MVLDLTNITAIFNQIPDILAPIPDILAALACVAIWGALIVLILTIVWALVENIGKVLKIKKN